jgi:hypothetical protein
MQTYLARLRNDLDSSTLKATLGLMLEESRAAIDRQRSLIALERLARRHSPIRLSQLRALEETRALVMAALSADHEASARGGAATGTGNVVQLNAHQPPALPESPLADGDVSVAVR